MRIRKIFGESSNYLKDLKKISFIPCIYFSGRGEKIYNESWMRGKNKILNLLKTIEEDLTLDICKENKDTIFKEKRTNNIIKENIFIIHGRDEAKWRELKEILKSEFNLNPIVLTEQPNTGVTIIDKFEKYASTCSCAIAIFTPDDEVVENDKKYLQARPNVIYEVSWFCGKLGRNKMILLLKKGTTIFSDFGGIVKNRFINNINEKISEIRKDLEQINVLSK